MLDILNFHGIREKYSKLWGQRHTVQIPSLPLPSYLFFLFSDFLNDQTGIKVPTCTSQDAPEKQNQKDIYVVYIMKC